MTGDGKELGALRDRDLAADAGRLVAGQTYEAWFPYTQDPVTFGDAQWRPGFTKEVYYYNDVTFSWNGEGVQRRTILAVVTLPAPYKPRVLFKRSWIDPTGKAASSPRPVEMCGEAAFKRWLSGGKTDFLFESGDMGDSPYDKRPWPPQTVDYRPGMTPIPPSKGI